MIIRTLIFIVLLVGLIFNHSIAQDSYSAYDLTRKMFSRTRGISTLKYEMRKWERIDGRMLEQHSFIKLNRDPLKVYIRQLYPKEGVELLYAKNENNNHALVNPNGFPWFNLSLDPLGSTIRKNQHHTIYQSGFDHVVTVLEHLFNKYGEETRTMVSFKGKSIIHGRECHIVEFNNPYFEYIPYTVNKGETIDSIAGKYLLSQHMIIEKNKKVNHLDDISEGVVITIPNDYSPRMELYIDSEELIPVVMKIYDDQGLYEHYEYRKVEVDPKILPDEFSSEFHEYDF